MGFQYLFFRSYSENFDELIQFYLDSDKQTVLSKLNLWLVVLKIDGQHPENELEALRLCKKEPYSNIYFLIQILCSLSVSTTTPI